METFFRTSKHEVLILTLNLQQTIEKIKKKHIKTYFIHITFAISVKHKISLVCEGACKI